MKEHQQGEPTTLIRPFFSRNCILSILRTHRLDHRTAERGTGIYSHSVVFLFACRIGGGDCCIAMPGITIILSTARGRGAQ